MLNFYKTIVILKLFFYLCFILKNIDYGKDINNSS